MVCHAWSQSQSHSQILAERQGKPTRLHLQIRLARNKRARARLEVDCAARLLRSRLVLRDHLDLLRRLDLLRDHVDLVRISLG